MRMIVRVVVITGAIYTYPPMDLPIYRKVNSDGFQIPNRCLVNLLTQPIGCLTVDFERIVVTVVGGQIVFIFLPIARQFKQFPVWFARIRKYFFDQLGWPKIEYL